MDAKTMKTRLIKGGMNPEAAERATRVPTGVQKSV